MDAKATQPKVTWMAVALIAATTMTSGGCAKLYHTIRYNCVSRLVGESHRTYYHGANTGKIVPKEKRRCNVYEPPCYGYEATCWHRWPEGCGVCQNQEEVIYDGPYTAHPPMGEPTYAAPQTQAMPAEAPVEQQPAPTTQRLPEIDNSIQLNEPPAVLPASPSDLEGARNQQPSVPRNAVEVPRQPVESVEPDFDIDEPIVEEPSETLPTYVDEQLDPSSDQVPLRESKLNNRRQMAGTPSNEANDLGLNNESPAAETYAPNLGADFTRQTLDTTTRDVAANVDSARRVARRAPTATAVERPATEVETPVVESLPEVAEVETPVAQTAPQRAVTPEATVGLPSLDDENVRRFAERHALTLPAPLRRSGPMPSPIVETARSSSRVPSFKLPVTTAKEVAAADQFELEQEEAETSELRFSDQTPELPQRLSSEAPVLKFR